MTGHAMVSYPTQHRNELREFQLKIGNIAVLTGAAHELSATSLLYLDDF
jgi:hypothetical protein